MKTAKTIAKVIKQPTTRLYWQALVQYNAKGTWCSLGPLGTLEQAQGNLDRSLEPRVTERLAEMSLPI